MAAMRMAVCLPPNLRYRQSPVIVLETCQHKHAAPVSTIQRACDHSRAVQQLCSTEEAPRGRETGTVTGLIGVSGFTFYEVVKLQSASAC